MSRKSPRGAALVALSVVLCAGVPSARADSPASAAERLVRAEYPEGLPQELAAGIGPEGATRLAEMLADPAEARHHPNAVVALGLCGEAAAYPALTRFAADEPRGELDSPSYRARLALPFALGQLARVDRRALADLLREAERPLEPPPWHYRHIGGLRLAEILRRAVISGLALSGRAEAGELLQRLQARAEADATASEKWRHHLQSSAALRERNARPRRGEPAEPGSR